MTLTSPLPHHNRRLTALALTVAVHLALLYGWYLSNRVSIDRAGDDGERIQWLLAPRAEPGTTPRPRMEPRVHLPPAAAPQRDVVQPAQSGSPLQEEPATAPVSAPAISIMDRARSAVGEIDRGLQEANKSKLIRAKPVSTQMRLERAMQKAHDAAPNKWYEAPKVTEVIDPGGYGRRRYRVVGALGTYCITIESNHAPDGIDTMQHGIKPKLTNCDDDEQAATKQDW